MRLTGLLIAAALACVPSGCGTCVNLMSSPYSQPCRAFGPTGCEPFGGVQKSFFFGCWCVGSVVAAPVGVLALADVPLSLAGDVVTLPIAYARQHRAPWATWWGEQEQSNSPQPQAAPLAGDGRGPPPDDTSAAARGQPGPRPEANGEHPTAPGRERSEGPGLLSAPPR